MFSFTFLILLVSIASTGATSQRLLLQQDRDVTVSELSKHSTYGEDLWISLKGIVYDVTSFEAMETSKMRNVNENISPTREKFVLDL